MIIGAILQKTTPTGKEAPFQYAYSTTDKETIEEVAARTEQMAENLRRQYPTYHYRTLVGEMTHEIEPPKPITVKVRALKKEK